MFEKILARIAGCLKIRKIPYMVIGGQAVLLYGEPRLTRDIDITLGLDTDDFKKVFAAAEEIHLKPIPRDVEDFVKKTMVLPLIDENTGIRVDFIFSFTPYESQAIKRARDVIMAGQSVRFASCEDVIIHKLFASRPQDIDDARNIILKNPGIDERYIIRWLKRFDEVSGGEKLQRTFEKMLKQTRRLRR